MLSVTNIPKIFEAIQKASAPETFHQDFLKDLGFKASNDRGAVKVLKYLGLLDQSGKPQSSYRDFMDKNKARKVLAVRIRAAFDDLFTADRQAHAKSVDNLKGWFKTKTGAGDAVAQKMASTFKALAACADFESPVVAEPTAEAAPNPAPSADGKNAGSTQAAPVLHGAREGNAFGLVYRFEIHLPDTQNVDTFRAIFRALREELL